MHASIEGAGALMTEQRRILVVEDQELVAETIATALEDDYTVICAGSAAEASPLLEQRAIDLILLDCLLPGGCTAETIALADRTGVPVVLMSGDLARAEALREGARPFLGKPFTVDTLLAVVREALART
jgi:DNA-binding response OmpR family regulator